MTVSATSSIFMIVDDVINDTEQRAAVIARARARPGPLLIPPKHIGPFLLPLEPEGPRARRVNMEV